MLSISIHNFRFTSALKIKHRRIVDTDWKQLISFYSFRLCCIHSLNNWICWLLMISKWHSMDFIEFVILVYLFFCTPQTNRWKKKPSDSMIQFNRKRILFIDIKAMMWLSTPSIKAPSPMLIWKPCNPLISHTVDILLMKFWCYDHFVHLALDLQKRRKKHMMRDWNY